MVLVLAACSSGPRTAAPATTTSARSTTVAPPTTTTTTIPTTTTTSPLVPIEGCADPGPYAEPDPRRPRYVATMDIDVAAGTVSGHFAVTFTPDLPTDTLVLRLWANAPVVAASGSHIDVGPFADGLTFEQPDATTVVVHLPRPHAAGDAVTVSTSYSLTVPGGNIDRVAHDGDTLRLGSVLPLLAWEPGVGWATEPPTTVHAEAATSPTADYDVAVETTPGYDVLGTGVRGDDGHFRASMVRDFALSVGHFEVASADVDGVAVSVGVDRDVGEDPNVQLGLVTDALRQYAARFGPYPWPTYTVAVTPGFRGGIEFPNHVMQGPGSAGRSVVHEVAHQWFYSLVGNDQGRDPWLDEGLASYAEFVQRGTLAAMSSTTIPVDAR